MVTLIIMDYNSGKLYSKQISDKLDCEQIEEMIVVELNFKMSEVYYMISEADPEIIDLDE